MQWLSKLLGGLTGDSTVSTLKELFVGEDSRKSQFTILLLIFNALLYYSKLLDWYTSELFKYVEGVLTIGLGYFVNLKLTKISKKLKK